MSVCWKPAWCECPDCGPLSQVVGVPNTCDNGAHNVVRLEIRLTERAEPWRSSYCDRCGLVNPPTAASVDPRLDHLLEVKE